MKRRTFLPASAAAFAPPAMLLKAVRCEAQ